MVQLPKCCIGCPVPPSTCSASCPSSWLIDQALKSCVFLGGIFYVTFSRNLFVGNFVCLSHQGVGCFFPVGPRNLPAGNP